MSKQKVLGAGDCSARKKRCVILGAAAGLMLLIGIGAVAYESWGESHKADGIKVGQVDMDKSTLGDYEAVDSGVTELGFPAGKDISGAEISDVIADVTVSRITEVDNKAVMEFTLTPKQDMVYSDLHGVLVKDSEDNGAMFHLYTIKEGTESDDSNQKFKAGETVEMKGVVDISAYKAPLTYQFTLGEKSLYLSEE